MDYRALSKRDQSEMQYRYFVDFRHGISVVGSYPIWGSDFFCVLLWLILYISLYFLYSIELEKKSSCPDFCR